MFRCITYVGQLCATLHHTQLDYVIIDIFSKYPSTVITHWLTNNFKLLQWENKEENRNYNKEILLFHQNFH